MFQEAADGRFPPLDGQVEVVPPLPRGLECPVAFTGHAVVATALQAEEVHAQGPDGFGGSLALVPDGEPVFAAVTPGNARSLRAFLAAGFVPLEGESIIRPQRSSAT